MPFINEEHFNDDDLESIWLIEHQIQENARERKGVSMETELGKQILYILNIPSNFTVDKTSSNSDRFELDFEQFKIG